MNEIIINENKQKHTIICIKPCYLLLSNNINFLYYLSWILYYFIYSKIYTFIILDNLNYIIIESKNKYNITNQKIIEENSLIHFCDYVLSLYFIVYIFNLK
jgi:hypothetical protein